MTAQDRDLVRRVAGASICGHDPLVWPGLEIGPAGLMCVVERRELPLRADLGKLVVLLTGESGGYVHWFTRRCGDGVLEADEWGFSADVAMIRREVGQLERYGLWELSDFAPATRDLMDGDYLVVRGYDLARGLAVDACLQSPEFALSPFLRKFQHAARRLLGRERAHFEPPGGFWQRLLPTGFGR